MLVQCATAATENMSPSVVRKSKQEIKEIILTEKTKKILIEGQEMAK